MSAGIFVFDVITTLVLSSLLLYSYGDWLRQRLFVTLSVLIAWYFSFLIIFVLPLDVSSTIYRQCLNQTKIPDGHHQTKDHLVITESDIHKLRNNLSSTTNEAFKVCQEPYSLLDENVLPNLWRLVYWTSQLLTWLILPVMQSFTQAGEFTFRGKLKSALWDNMIYYTSYAFIAIILFIYIATHDLDLNWERLKAIAASASNTWGLFVLVLMLGYGLVEVPRNCWNRSLKGYQLTRAYFRVAKLMSEKSDAEEELDDVLITVNTIAAMAGDNDFKIRKMVDTILGKVPIEMLEKIKRRRTEVDFGNDTIPTEKTLIKLHRQVIKALQNFHRTEAQWDDWTNYVFELEDINKNLVSNDHQFVHSLSKKKKFWFNSPKIEWYWRCLLAPLMLRFFAVLSGFMSVLIVWSEVTFFSKSPTLSIFAALVSGFNPNYFAIEATCIATIFYLCLCTFYTIFKIRIFNYYYLARNHHSDEYTLLFSGALLCRLTPPLCLNFLSLIHMDSHIIKADMEETAYTMIMGHMDVVSIVADYFNVYFPIALLVLTCATYFSVGARVLTMLGFQQFLAQDSDLTLELVEEGKEHIKREKRRRQRLAESATRRRDFANRFGDIESNTRDARLRASDIVKGNRGGSNGGQPSSPERSLLSEPSGHQQCADNNSIFTESIDLSSPTIITYNNTEPPRNIFDDI